LLKTPPGLIPAFEMSRRGAQKLTLGKPAEPDGIGFWYHQAQAGQL
jgi:hypothetical protein